MSSKMKFSSIPKDMSKKVSRPKSGRTVAVKSVGKVSAVGKKGPGKQIF